MTAEIMLIHAKSQLECSDSHDAIVQMQLSVHAYAYVNIANLYMHMLFAAAVAPLSDLGPHICLAYSGRAAIHS